MFFGPNYSNNKDGNANVFLVESPRENEEAYDDQERPSYEPSKVGICRPTSNGEKDGDMVILNGNGAVSTNAPRPVAASEASKKRGKFTPRKRYTSKDVNEFLSWWYIKLNGGSGGGCSACADDGDSGSGGGGVDNDGLSGDIIGDSGSGGGDGDKKGEKCARDKRSTSGAGGGCGVYIHGYDGGGSGGSVVDDDSGGGGGNGGDVDGCGGGSCGGGGGGCSGGCGA